MKSTVVSSKERQSNLELYRIIVMLLIVAHHYVVNSGLFPLLAENPLDGRSLSMYLAGMWGKTGINCFVLITGYFMCQSHITVQKFFKLLFEVEFYRVVIYLVFLLSGYEVFSWFNLLKILSPVIMVGSNFVGCFLLFFLLIPFLNLLIRNMNHREHLTLLSLCLFIYTFLSMFCFVSMNYVSWFCVLFILAAYLRKYGCWRIKPSWWKWIALSSIVLSMASVWFILWVNEHFSLTLYPYRFVSDSNAFFAVTTAVSSFMAFKYLRIKQSKIINLISRSSFGVLLIHAHSDSMRNWLWVDTLNNVGNFQTSEFPIIHLVGCVLVIYALCTFIDYLRITFIEKPVFQYVDKFLYKKNLL